MDYAIYDPEIITQTVIDPYNDPSGLTYVSNSSLEYWRGKFWAIMDGNAGGLNEGNAGQKIWLTTSDDGETWAQAVQPFRDSSYCNNPITVSTGTEWQPNLVVVNDELWCIWSGSGDLAAYVSKLTDPAGKWTNYRFEFDASNHVTLSSTINGAATGGRNLTMTFGAASDYWAFPTQNPIVLQDGSVLCPVAAVTYSQFSTQITTTNVWLTQLKFAVLLRWDGDAWSTVVVDTSAFGDYCAWEPFVVENPAGHVYCYVRNLSTLSADPDMMLVAVSTDGGETFTAAKSSKLLVPSTRGFARRITNRRWAMVHCDHPQNSNQTPNQSFSPAVRRNGAVFMSRRGSNDFIPGVNFSGDDPCMNYPQFTVHDGKLWINYTSGTGTAIRRSLKVVTVDLPDDTVGLVCPRSVNKHTTITAPPVVAGSPPYFDFTGLQQVVSADSVTATSGLTYAAWVQLDADGAVIADNRNATGTSGAVFMLTGLALRSLNFFHGATIIPGTPVFLAAALDNTALTVNLYVGTGTGSFTTKTGYFKSVLFSGQPADGDTLTVNGVTYTFKTSASAGTDVQIGASTTATVNNLASKLAANSMATTAPGGGRLIMARTNIATFSVSSGSSQISVDTSIPLNSDPVSFGMKSVTSSTLAAWASRIYDARLYDSALSLANITYLHNALTTALGLTAIAGTSTAPSSPLLHLDPASPDTVAFPALATTTVPPYCEIVDEDTLRIHGEGSASVELPYGATELTIRYKLGAAPSESDKYVIASFGTTDSPTTLYIDHTNPTKLYCQGREVATVATPTNWNTATVIVSTDKITIGSFEQYFAGKPRCYLGSAYPESLLAVTKTIDYDISAMTATRARRNT